MARTKFPSIAAVRAELVAINRASDACEDGIDVRLQVSETGLWSIRWGDSGYDQYHQGFWGAGSIPGGRKRFNATDEAKTLLDQAREMQAQCEDATLAAFVGPANNT